MRPIALALLLLSSTTSAFAAERPRLQIATGASGASSTWRGDPAVLGSLRLGVRFLDLFSIDAIGRLGYAAVDQRTLTYLGLGATLYGRVGVARPFARALVVHQHEETIAAIANDPGGALLGVGDGIRHRGGFSFSLGVDVPFWRRGGTELFAGLDALATVFPDAAGPTWYLGGGLWIGLNYGL